MIYPLPAQIKKVESLFKIHSLINVNLAFIDPGVTAFGGYRWRDIAGNLYSDSYRNSYGYLKHQILYGFLPGLLVFFAASRIKQDI